MPKKNDNSADTKDASQWMFLMNEPILTKDGENEGKPTICKLKHPKTETGSLFMFDSEGHSVYEITQFKEQCRSWFINETVQHDGSLYMTIPVDPTYLALPYLIEAEKSGKYQVLDQIITDSDFPECGRLCQCLGEDELSHIAEVKGTGDIKAYRYNKDQTLAWLRKKVEQVSDKLQSENINVSGGALSHLFVRSTKTTNSSQEDYTRFAHGLVSDYLPEDVSKELKELIGIKDPEPPKHEKPDIEEPAAKKVKTEKLEPTEDYSQHGAPKEDNKKSVKSVAQNKLGKVDKKGMKSISSFFSPKSKK